MPLQEAVKPDRRADFSKMYVRTCAGIIATYICFGALNWIAYGKSTQVVLTLNLPRGPWKASVQLAYSLAVVFTFPLQLYPAVQILKSVGRKLKRLSVSRVGYHRRLGAIDDPTTVEPPSETDTEADTPTRAIKPPRPRTSKLEGNAARTASSRCSSPWPWPRSGASTRSSRSSAASSASRSPSSRPLAVHLRLVPNAPARTRRWRACAMAVGAVLGLVCSAVTLLTSKRSLFDVGLYSVVYCRALFRSGCSRRLRSSIAANAVASNTGVDPTRF